MLTRRQILASVTAGSSFLFAGTSRTYAQTVQKLTRIVIGVPAGAPQDTVARLLINHMKGYASTIILEHRSGAGYRIAIESVKNSAADGSTILFAPAGALALYPHIFKELKYKPLEDFTPVTTIFHNPAVLVVGQKVPVEVATVADFIGWCRANPGQSAYGTPGAGSPMHLLGSVLAKTAGFELVHVPYQGSGPAIQDVLGGQIASAITNLPTVIQYLDTGRLRVLATTGPERSSLLSNVPTMNEVGYPALEFSEWFGFLLPARTPAPIANALNTVILEALKSEEIRSGLAKLSLEPSGISLNEFSQRLRADTQRWELLVKASGFTGE